MSSSDDDSITRDPDVVMNQQSTSSLIVDDGKAYTERFREREDRRMIDLIGDREDDTKDLYPVWLGGRGLPTPQFTIKKRFYEATGREEKEIDLNPNAMLNEKEIRDFPLGDIALNLEKHMPAEYEGSESGETSEDGFIVPDGVIDPHIRKRRGTIKSMREDNSPMKKKGRTNSLENVSNPPKRRGRPPKNKKPESPPRKVGRRADGKKKKKKKKKTKTREDDDEEEGEEDEEEEHNNIRGRAAGKYKRGVSTSIDDLFESSGDETPYKKRRPSPVAEKGSRKKKVMERSEETSETDEEIEVQISSGEESDMPSSSRGRKSEKKRKEDEKKNKRRQKNVGGEEKTAQDIYREQSKKAKQRNRKNKSKKESKKLAAIIKEKKQKSDDRDGWREGSRGISSDEDSFDYGDDDGTDLMQFYVPRRGPRSRSGSPVPTTMSSAPGSNCSSRNGSRAGSRVGSRVGSRMGSREGSPEGGVIMENIDQNRLQMRLVIEHLKREQAEEKRKREEDMERKRKEQMEKNEAAKNAPTSLPNEKIRAKAKIAMRSGRDAGIVDTGPATSSIRSTVQSKRGAKSGLPRPLMNGPTTSVSASSSSNILDTIELEMDQPLPIAPSVDRSLACNNVNGTRGAKRIEYGGTNSIEESHPSKEKTTNERRGRSPPAKNPSSSSSIRPPTKNPSSSSSVRPPTKNTTSSSSIRPPTKNTTSSSSIRPPTKNPTSSSSIRTPTTFLSPPSSSSLLQPPSTPSGPSVLDTSLSLHPTNSSDLDNVGGMDEYETVDCPASPNHIEDDDDAFMLEEEEEDGYGMRVESLLEDNTPSGTPVSMPIHEQFSPEMNAKMANQILGSIWSHLEDGTVDKVIIALDWKLAKENKSYFDRCANRQIIFDKVNEIRDSPPTPIFFSSLIRIIRWDSHPSHSDRSRRIEQSKLRGERLHPMASLSFVTLPFYAMERDREGREVVVTRMTPLSEAVRLACSRETARLGFQWAEFLIKNGAHVNDRVKYDDFEGYIIHYAIENADESALEFQIIRLLLAYGANRVSARTYLESMKATTILQNEDINEENFYELVPYYSDLHALLMESCDSVSESFRDQLHLPEFGGFTVSYIDETVCTVPYEKTLVLEFAAHFNAAMTRARSNGRSYPPVFAVVAGIATISVVRRNELPLAYRDSTVRMIRVGHTPCEPLFELFPCAFRSQGSLADPPINSIPFVPLRDDIGVFIIPRQLYPHLKSCVINFKDNRVGVDRIVFGGLFRLIRDGEENEEKVWEKVIQMEGARGEQFDGFY